MEQTERLKGPGEQMAGPEQGVRDRKPEMTGQRGVELENQLERKAGKKEEGEVKGEEEKGGWKRGEAKSHKRGKILPLGWEWTWLEDPWTKKWELLMVPREGAERRRVVPAKPSYWG